jgi:hypothetical protein
MVVERSTELTTSVVAVADSLPGAGSVAVEAMLAVLLRLVPPLIDAGTATVSVKVPLEPLGKFASVHVTAPPAPTAGVVQLQPTADARETNVVPAGSVSLIVALNAGSGPALETLIV